MKNICILILCLFSIFRVLAQSFATIKGEVSNPSKQFMILHSTDDYWISIRQDTIKLNKSGSFSFRYPLQDKMKDVFLEVSHNQKFPLYIAKNQVLIIKLIDSVTPPVFSGPLLKIHQFKADEKELEQNIYNHYKNRHPALEQDSFFGSDSYFKIQDSITADRIASVRKYFKNAKAAHEKAFVRQQVNSLIYSNLVYILNSDHAKIERFKPYQVHLHLSTAQSYRFSDSINFSDPSLLKYHYYQSFSNGFFSAIARKNLSQKQDSFSKEQYYHEIFQLLNAYSKNRKANALLKAVFLNDEVRSLKYESADEVTIHRLQQYLDVLGHEKTIQQEVFLIGQNLDAILEEKLALKRGTLAPNVELLDSLGNKKNLSDYKGKLVYIDVWASWCKPCINSIPYWNQLVKQFADRKDINFLFISIDDDVSNWTKALERFKPQGDNFSSLGGFKESELARKYKIRALPSTILIDEGGKIINASAERPENIDLLKYLK